MARTFWFVLFTALLPGTVVAQTRRSTPPGPSPESIARSQSIAASLALEPPSWLKEYRFSQTKFTFLRVQYDTIGPRRAAHWATDYPDAELNLVAMLGRLTKLDVSQPSRVLRLTDPAIAEFPIVYLAEPGLLTLAKAEIEALRKYLAAGGFLFMDDFWGEAETQNALAVMKQVFPDREPVDLPLSHPVFHCVFDLKEKPQVTSIHTYYRGQATERVDALAARYRAIQDNRGRIIVLMCQNTDLADGWERAGEDAKYAREMSIAKAYPLGINIIFFALTQGKQAK